MFITEVTRVNCSKCGHRTFSNYVDENGVCTSCELEELDAQEQG